MTRPAALVLAAALAQLVVGPLAARQAPAGGQSQEGVVAPQTGGQATFRAAVNLVTTDVIVRDGRGQFVADLKGSDFAVFEDGVAQDIASVVLIHGARVFNMQAPPPPPVSEGIILPPVKPVSDAAGRIFVFFVDDLHLTFRETARTRDLFKRILKNLLHDGDMFGIVSTGPSSLSIQLTYDHKVLEEAISRITGDGLKPSDIMQQQQGPNGPMELRYRSHVAFKTAFELVKNLERINNRRKAVIYVSSGYDFNPFEVSRLRQEQERFGGAGSTTDPTTGEPQDRLTPFSSRTPDQSGAQFADTDLAIELAELARAANRANATLYTIDPRGLVAGMDLDEEIEPRDWDVYVRKTQDSLRTLAELTGGIAVVNQNDFDRALKRIDAETSDYYVLGYYSSNPDPLRRNRRIEVKVPGREGLDVWARRGYSLPEAGATPQ
ncbi:MAG: VWA domain-containing protein [Acidimicrobiia bacterium]|nr:VWA domain-containing protein [Acidimicrobiia bacterium]